MIPKPAAPPQRDPSPAELRAAVLAVPELAAKLCAPPIGYDRPEQWNGYVPPLRDEHNLLSNSPRRAALAAIVDEVSGGAR